MSTKSCFKKFHKNVIFDQLISVVEGDHNILCPWK